MKNKILALSLIFTLLLSVILSSAPHIALAEEAVPNSKYTGTVNGGGFENDDDLAAWSVSNEKDRTISIDTENTYGGSDGALLVDMPTSYYGSSVKPLTFKSDIIDGKEQDFDPESDYYASFYLKTSEDFNGSVYIRLRQGFTNIAPNGSSDIFLLGTKSEGASGYKDWMRFDTPTFSLSKKNVTVTLYINGTGKVWIDDINVKYNDNLVKNGGFEDSAREWNNYGSQEEAGEKIDVVSDETCASPSALRLSRDDTTIENGILYMASAGVVIDPNKQYTLSVDVKTEGTKIGGAFIRVFQRYKNEAGEDAVSFLTCYGSDNAIATGGDTDWTNFKVRLSGWKKTITSFNLMIYIEGYGTVWYDNISITERQKANVSAGEIAADPPAGEVAPLSMVSLISSGDTDDIYYTVDGTDPKTSETTYLYDNGVGIPISKDCKIKAFAVSEEAEGEVFEFDYTCTKPIIEDDVLWDVVHLPGIVTLDTTTKVVGKNSIKIKGQGNMRYVSTGDIRIDGTYDYKLSFRVKTEALMNPENAFVNLFMPGSGSMQNNIDGRYGAYYKTENLISMKETQDWTYYEFVIDGLNAYWEKFNITVGLYNEVGTLWIDDVKLDALPYENYPLTVSGDGKVFGNNYYTESLFGNLELDQGYIIKNNANNIESGVMTYRVVNDLRPDDVIGEGDVNVAVFGKAMNSATANLTMCGSYGTYTVSFEMKNSRGHKYPAGEIKVARVRDVTSINNESLIGINSQSSRSDIFAKTGIKTVRTDLKWSEIYPVEGGELEIPQSMEDFVNSSINNNIDVMFILGNWEGPSWYKPGEPDRFPVSDKEISQFAEFCKKVAVHYKGKVKYYEIYNEANWAGVSTATPQEYVNVLKAAYTAIKSVDPDASVVAGATSLFDAPWSTEVMKLGANYMDYYSTHPYANPKSPETRDWFTQLENLQAAAKEVSGREIPFLLTELGFSVNESGGGVTEQQQLKWQIRQLAFANAADYVDGVYLYRDFCPASDNKYVQETRWGIYDNSFDTDGWAHAVAPGLAAFTYMTNGYTFAGSEKLAENIYVHKYTGAENDMYLLWTNDMDYEARVTTTNTSGRAYDIFGNIMPLTYDEETSSIDMDINGYISYFTLDKGQSISKIEILNLDNEAKPEPKPVSPQNPESNSNNTGFEEYEDTTINESTNDEKPKAQQVIKKKKTVKKVIKAAPEKENNLPLILGLIGGGVALLLIAAGVIFIVIRKKKGYKKKIQI